MDNFFYRHLVGINFDTANPGFKKIVLTPKFIEQIDFARGSYQSIHGEIKAEWERDSSGDVEYRVTIPANCQAEAVLPGGNKVLKSGCYTFSIQRSVGSANLK